jgi:hypothetical protein
MRRYGMNMSLYAILSQKCDRHIYLQDTRYNLHRFILYAERKPSPSKTVQFDG